MKKTAMVSAGVLMAALLAGCAPAEPTSAPSVLEGCEGATIGDSIPQASDPGLNLISQGFVAEAKARGAEVVSADANLEVNQQLADVDGFVQRGVDAVTAWPMDGTALRPALERADAAGIVLVTQQTPEGVKTATNVQFDAHGAGVALALYLGDQLGSGAKVAAIVGPQQVDSFRSMAEGFAEGAATAGLDVVETQANSELSPQKSAEIAEQLRTRYGDELDGIYDALSYTALGAASAKTPDFAPVIVTYGGGAETNEAIADGRFTAAIDVLNPLIGRAKAWVVCQRLAGEELPGTMEVPFLIVDESNVAEMPTDAEQLKADVDFEALVDADGNRIAYNGITLPELAGGAAK